MSDRVGADGTGAGGSKLPRGLIVSCQAREGNPLRGPAFMAAMARAAVAGGAVAIRAEGADDIRAIRDAVDVPIVGLLKRGRSSERPYITPDLDAARRVADAGADWIAVDATARERPGGPVATFLPTVRAATSLPVLADVSDLAEGVAAWSAGADAVATTLSGYVANARGAAARPEPVFAARAGSEDPDLELVAALAARIGVPVVAEGRYAGADQAAAALARGAHAVVVGTAITNPMAITARFAEAVAAEMAKSVDGTGR